MKGTFNHDFQVLQLEELGPSPVTADNWCTNDGYGSGTDNEVLLQLWPGALECCCLSTPPGFHKRVESYELAANNYG
jgi:hypothetical protein